MNELKELIENILVKLVKAKIKNYILKGCLILLAQYILIMILIAIIVASFLFCYGYTVEIFRQILNK
jgi:hypothetical protein